MKIITECLDLIPEIDLQGICSPEEMLFFDIETTGLKKETTQLYLIGCVFLRDGKWQLKQWLAQSTSDEEYILEDFLDLAGNFKALIHFNGDRFDVPYIKYKADYYMIDNRLDDMKSFDIYLNARISRNLLGLSSMSQKSVEAFLGVGREDVYDGGKLISVYYEYEKTGSENLEQLLLLHNHDDLTGMLQILPILDYCEIFKRKYSFSDSSISGGTLTASFRTDKPMPVPGCVCCGKEEDNVVIRVSEDLLQISIGVLETEAKLYFENASDYYYLPEQDMVIHKDLAKFTDRSKRTKATKNNCYVKKTGRFIPYFEGWEGRIFFCPDRKGKRLIDLEDAENTGCEAVYETMAAYYIDSIAVHGH